MRGFTTLVFFLLGLWLLRRVWLFFRSLQAKDQETPIHDSSKEYGAQLKRESIVEAEFEEVGKDPGQE